MGLDLAVDGRMTSVDPASGAILGTVECASGARIDALAVRAQTAFHGPWARDGVLRAAALNRWADVLEARADEIAELLTRETGKVRSESATEVALSVDALRYNAGIARHLGGAAATMRDGSATHLVRQPLGVTAFIVPWNWPLFLLVRDLGPALAAGVTALVKPAPQTPLATEQALETAAASGMPDGVLGCVHGEGDVGQALIDHPAVRVVSFTGSTHVGRLVGQAAARGFKRALLELGGKGVSVIFADADLDQAVDACIAGAFITSGQMCMANSRILVERGVRDALYEAVCDRVQSLRAGSPQDAGSDMGPLISPAHLERVLGYVQLAADNVAVGGKRLGGDLAAGNYMAPTVIAGDELPARVVTEEIFGPVVTVESFGSEDEALRRANATPYGLAASVWTNDARRAWRMANGIDAGTVWVNRYNRMFPEVPSGGMKDSGIGRTRGIEGMHEFTELKHISWDVQ